jgi:3-deoxy-D-manno-octulosonic-acid transferase
MNDARLLLYNALLMAFAPALLLKKAAKFRRRGHAHEWDLQRWNAPAKLESLRRRNDSNAAQPIRVVLVALSWGEVGVLNEISTRLESVRPDVEIVWSIRERDAQIQARRAFPNRAVVSMPFDFAAPVARWMETVAPDVLVVVEKFWWPNLVWSAKNRGARVVLVNGRSRGRERARYRLMTPFQKWVLGAFDALCLKATRKSNACARCCRAAPKSWRRET